MDASKQQQTTAMTGPVALSKGMLLLVSLLLLWIYGYQLVVNPLIWEEPRRCLVALEMIYRGDYIVPHVLGEPYRNKPPMQNWLLILLAGHRAERVGAVPLRLISFLSLLGIAWCLWWSTRDQHPVSPAWLPGLLFLTMGIVIQYGPSGEVDPLFTFWTVAALCCFDAGRRRQAAWLQWGLSQTILAGGILTKGLAPVFFYPPVLYCAWQDRRSMPFAWRCFLLGLAVEIALVLAWLIPYAERSAVASLGQQLAAEVLARTPIEYSGFEFVAHLMSFPVVVLGAMLPWSAVFGLCLLPQVRSSIRQALRLEPSFQLAVAVILWSVGLLWLMPGAKSRYLLPGFVFLAVLCGRLLTWGYATGPTTISPLLDRFSRLLRETRLTCRTMWLGLGLLWGGGICLTAYVTGLKTLWQPLLTGLLALFFTVYIIRRRMATWWFSLLLLMALLYGIVYTGVNRVLLLEPRVRRTQAASQIAAAIEEPLPVVCGPGASSSDCFVISRYLRRPVQRRHPPNGSYFLVTALQHEPQRHSQPLVQVVPLTLWRVPGHTRLPQEQEQ